MTELAVLFLVAAAAFGLVRWLRLPEFPLLLGAGFLLSVVGITPGSTELQSLVSLGLTFLVFSAGIEFTPERIRPQSRRVLSVSISQFLVVGVVGYLAAWGLGFRGLTAVYLACALCTSSTLVVLRQLTRRQQRFEPFGRMALGTLLVQDLLMIGVIVVLMRLPEGPGPLAEGIAATLAVIALAFVCQRWVVPWIVERLNLDVETLMLSILALLFLFVGLVVNLDVPAVAGAFLAGFVLSTFPVNGLVRGVLNPLTDFFLALFFTGLGAMLVIPGWMILLQAGVFVLVIIVLTPIIVTVVAEMNGFSSRAAIESGLVLAQNSEFSLILALSGLAAGHISQGVFSVIAFVTVITMTLTPFLADDRVTRRLLQWHPVRRRPQRHATRRRPLPSRTMEGHILLLGFGAGGMWVVKPLLAEKHQVLVVDDDPIIVRQLQRNGIPAIRGDGSDEQVLQRAGADRARLILASMRRVADAAKILEFVQGRVPVIVRVFENSDAEWVRELGGIPILNSQAAAERFAEWFEKSGLAARQTAALEGSPPRTN